MIHYRIETRSDKHSEDWQVFLDWTDWDTAYAAWKPEYERQSKLQWEGFVNIRMLRDVSEHPLDNCLLYDAWVQRSRKQQARRDAIVAAVQKIQWVNTDPDVAAWLHEILDNLEEVQGEDWEEKRLRKGK